MYICVFVCIFVYIFEYLCIFLYIRTYLQKMRRAICDKKFKIFKIIENRATIAIRCAARFATKESLAFHNFSLTFTNFPKSSNAQKLQKLTFPDS